MLLSHMPVFRCSACYAASSRLVSLVKTGPAGLGEVTTVGSYDEDTDMSASLTQSPVEPSHQGMVACVLSGARNKRIAQREREPGLSKGSMVKSD